MPASGRAATIAYVQHGAAYTAEQLSLIAWRERRSEWGGLVWGRLYAAPHGPLAWLAAMTPGVGRSSAVDFEMDPESYVIGLRMLKRSGFPSDLEELGMWHSHPTYGAFLSSVDEEYFRICFPQAGKVSVVLDPIGEDRAVYVKSPAGTKQIPGYLYTGRAFGRVPALDPQEAWEAVQGGVR